MDHITPSARGGATEPDNITLACISLPPAENWLGLLARFRLDLS
ncbi:MAG: HNH endonuclease [Isosphaeraceae bacterium]